MIKGDILECWIDGKLNLTFDNHYVQRQYVIPGLDRKNKEVIVKVINAEAVPMPMTLNIRNGELKLAFETEKFEMMNIKNCMLSACAGMLGLAAGCVSEPDGEIKVDFARKGADIPASMYGIFFEEINHSGGRWFVCGVGTKPGIRGYFGPRGIPGGRQPALSPCCL